MNANNPMTPGVYTREVNAFPNSVPMVPTAVPAFIGYTTKTSSPKGENLTKHPRFISSFREFTDLFGGQPPIQFTVDETKTPPTSSPQTATVKLSGDKSYDVTLSARFYLYDALRMYFANGGGPCYVVSVGLASSTPGKKSSKDFWDTPAMDQVLKEIPFPKPTIICIPDARMCSDPERLALYSKVLKHCTDLADRIVLMDVPTTNRKPVDDAKTFRDTVSGDKPSYGAAYYPELLTNLYDQDNLDGSMIAKPVITSPPLLADGDFKALLGANGNTDTDNQTRKQKHASLLARDPNTPSSNTIASDYKALLSAMASVANVMPPSAAMAGIYARVDSDVGVWRAPANTNILGVVAPTVTVTDDTQAGLNVDANAGKSINAIRSFYGRGPAIVWGARTLDGNSKDWRYINVRRTVILIEQSVANAAFSMVFEPNTAPTWTTCRAMIAGFLRSLWAAGALQGATPEDAFSVTVGLGTTMTADDILDGIMRIEVKLALVRPAEFIVITYQQQMAKS